LAGWVFFRPGFVGFSKNKGLGLTVWDGAEFLFLVWWMVTSSAASERGFSTLEFGHSSVLLKQS
jgi:hypothetical protein